MVCIGKALPVAVYGQVYNRSRTDCANMFFGFIKSPINAGAMAMIAGL